jgi:hypothetical protein
MVCPKGHGPSPEGGEPQMKNVSLAPVVMPFARGLAMSELVSGLRTTRDGGSGVNAAAAWRPAMRMRATYAAAAIAALPTVKATVATATKQHLVTTAAGRGTTRTNGTQGSPPRRIPV